MPAGLERQPEHAVGPLRQHRRRRRRRRGRCAAASAAPARAAARRVAAATSTASRARTPCGVDLERRRGSDGAHRMAVGRLEQARAQLVEQLVGREVGARRRGADQHAPERPRQRAAGAGQRSRAGATPRTSRATSRASSSVRTTASTRFIHGGTSNSRRRWSRWTGPLQRQRRPHSRPPGSPGPVCTTARGSTSESVAPLHRRRAYPVALVGRDLRMRGAGVRRVSCAAPARRRAGCRRRSITTYGCSSAG